MAVVAFDFDGTVVDSMPLLEDLAVSILGDGAHPLTDEAIRVLYRWSSGRPFEEQLQLVFANDMAHAGLFAANKPEIYKRAKPCLDIFDAIELVRERGDRSVLVTSTVPELAVAWLEANHLHVDTVLGFMDNTLKKRDQLLLASADVFMGDSEYDAMVAWETGIEFVRAKRDESRLVELERDWYGT